MEMDGRKDPRTHAIIGAAIEVHRQLGPGFLEAVYREALGLELAARGVTHECEVELPISYKGHRLATAYRADMICCERIVVELKALPRLSGTEESQIINYLKATGHHLGLLLNFGAASLEYKRFVFGPPDSVEVNSKSVQSVKSVDSK